MLTLEGLLRRKQVLVCLGSGGVGKTTTSAVLALQAAVTGKKAVVLTIDPARRLADSLGLKSLENEPVRVDPAHLEGLGVPVKGELWAMMLNSSLTLEEIIRRYSTNEEQVQSIINSKIYTEGIQSLIGSPEYMAVEKLYELHESGSWDLVIVDTPPAKHALDFLTAPDRMVNFLTDNKFLNLLIRPAFQSDSFGARIARWGSERFMKVLELAFSREFLMAGSEFFTAMNGLYDGFKSRSLRMQRLFRDPEHLGFVIVTSPNRLTLDEAVYLHSKLIEHRMPFEGIVVNKVHRNYLQESGGAEGFEELARVAHRAEDPAEAAGRVRAAAGDLSDPWAAEIQALLRNFGHYQLLAEIDAKNLERLRYLLKGDQFMSLVPYFEQDIHDVAGLRQVSELLFTGGARA